MRKLVNGEAGSISSQQRIRFELAGLIRQDLTAFDCPSPAEASLVGKTRLLLTEQLALTSPGAVAESPLSANPLQERFAGLGYRVHYTRHGLEYRTVIATCRPPKWTSRKRAWWTRRRRAAG